MIFFEGTVATYTSFQLYGAVDTVFSFGLGADFLRRVSHCRCQLIGETVISHGGNHNEQGAPGRGDLLGSWWGRGHDDQDGADDEAELQGWEVALRYVHLLGFLILVRSRSVCRREQVTSGDLKRLYFEIVLLIINDKDTKVDYPSPRSLGESYCISKSWLLGPALFLPAKIAFLILSFATPGPSPASQHDFLFLSNKKEFHHGWWVFYEPLVPSPLPCFSELHKERW